MEPTSRHLETICGLEGAEDQPEALQALTQATQVWVCEEGRACWAKKAPVGAHDFNIQVGELHVLGGQWQPWKALAAQRVEFWKWLWRTVRI